VEANLHISSSTKKDDEQAVATETSLTTETSSNETTLSDADLDSDPSLTNCIIQNGYTLVPSSSSNTDKQLVSDLAEGITQLHKNHALPATFILLFDEAWHLALSATTNILSQTTHEMNQFNFDVLAWYIDPSEGISGFSPHRDRQPLNHLVKDSFHEDGQAKYVTLWMALSHATAENSCLYVIPKDCDPGYLNGDDVDEEEEQEQEHKKDKSANANSNSNQQDPLTRCLSSKESYQNIRALPRAPGESVAFTHRILHWGSRGNKNCINSPRIAISFVCSDPSFERPYLKNYERYWTTNINTSTSTSTNYSSASAGSTKGIVLPPFEIRLLLVCAQLLIYYQRFDLPKDTIRACYEYCKEFKDELEPTYWKKVSLEFVKAMREVAVAVAVAVPVAVPVINKECDKNLVSEISGVGDCNENKLKVDIGGGEEDEDNDDDDDDDDDDALLEAMLENADDVEDDFEDMEDDEEGESPISQVGNGNDESDFDSSDEDEECNLFGSVSDEPQKKKLKV